MLKKEQLLLNFMLLNQTKISDSIQFEYVLGIDLVAAFHKASFNNLRNNDIGLISNNALYKKNNTVLRFL